MSKVHRRAMRGSKRQQVTFGDLLQRRWRNIYPIQKCTENGQIWTGVVQGVAWTRGSEFDQYAIARHSGALLSELGVVFYQNL